MDREVAGIRRNSHDRYEYHHRTDMRGGTGIRILILFIVVFLIPIIILVIPFVLIFLVLEQCFTFVSFKLHPVIESFLPDDKFAKEQSTNCPK